MHDSLTFKSNLKLIIVYIIVLSIMLLYFKGSLLYALLIGIAIGMPEGYLQFKALVGNWKNIQDSKTAFDVRKSLLSTKYGKGFIFYFWISAILLLIISFAFTRENSFYFVPFCIEMYIAKLATRDMITLPFIKNVNPKL